jgi:hypothetical protein
VGWDYNWQRLFAWSGILFLFFMGTGLEIFMPQPPRFDISAVETARYYTDHQLRILIGMTLCSIGYVFELLWTMQLGAMLWRLERGSRIATLAATVGLVSTPLLGTLDIAVFCVAAYRPSDINPEITRALSDVAWIASMLIWPPLMFGMIAVGIIILKTQGHRYSFPKWTGWASIVTGLMEPHQAAIIFTKTGLFAPDGLMSWYGAVFTWGPWIFLMGVAMIRMLNKAEYKEQMELDYDAAGTLFHEDASG